MGLQKANAGANARQPAAISSQEQTYREELVSIYKSKLVGADLEAASTDEFLAIIANQAHLASNLHALGKEREANILRRKAIRAILSRSAEIDRELFALTDSIIELHPAVASSDQEFEALNKKRTELMQSAKKKFDEAVAEVNVANESGSEGVDALKAKRGEELKARNDEFKNFLENEFNPKVQENRKIHEQYSKFQGQLGELAIQSQQLKVNAVGFMMDLGNIHGAFEFSLGALHQYYAKEMFGVAETVLSSCFALSQGALVKRLNQGGTVEDLYELGIESALEAAQVIEAKIAAVPSDNQIKQNLPFAIQFRQFAATISAETGNVDDISSILVDSAAEYEGMGFKNESLQLTMVASEFFYKLAANALHDGRPDDARSLGNSAIALKLSVAEAIEDKALQRGAGSQPSEEDQMQAMMAQMFDGMQPSEPTLSDAIEIRASIVSLCIDLKRFSEINEIIKSAAEKYKANGFEEEYLSMLEFGANVARKETAVLQSLKRDSDYTHPGNYL